MTEILKGKPVARDIYAQVKDKIAGLDVQPLLSIIIPGDDPAALFYVDSIRKKATKYGIETRLVQLPENCDEQTLIDAIRSQNKDPKVHGIILQKPLPRGCRDRIVAESIAPEKDVDGIHPLNLGRLMMETDCFIPCTAQAVIEMIGHYRIPVAGSHTVILGRSLVLGKPLAGLLLYKRNTGNATVTVCHSRTPDIASVTQRADIIVTAIGKAEFLKADIIREGVTILDVGTNAITDDRGETRYTGDTDYKGCLPLCSAITPVPGGIGSVTTAVLLRNVVLAATHFVTK